MTLIGVDVGPSGRTSAAAYPAAAASACTWDKQDLWLPALLGARSSPSRSDVDCEHACAAPAAPNQGYAPTGRSGAIGSGYTPVIMKG